MVLPEHRLEIIGMGLRGVYALGEARAERRLLLILEEIGHVNASAVAIEVDLKGFLLERDEAFQHRDEIPAALDGGGLKDAAVGPCKQRNAGEENSHEENGTSRHG